MGAELTESAGDFLEPVFRVLCGYRRGRDAEPDVRFKQKFPRFLGCRLQVFLAFMQTAA